MDDEPEFEQLAPSLMTVSHVALGSFGKSNGSKCVEVWRLIIACNVSLDDMHLNPSDSDVPLASNGLGRLPTTRKPRLPSQLSE